MWKLLCARHLAGAAGVGKLGHKEWRVGDWPEQGLQVKVKVPGSSQDRPSGSALSAQEPSRVSQPWGHPAARLQGRRPAHVWLKLPMDEVWAHSAQATMGIGPGGPWGCNRHLSPVGQGLCPLWPQEELCLSLQRPRNACPKRTGGWAGGEGPHPSAREGGWQRGAHVASRGARAGRGPLVGPPPGQGQGATVPSGQAGQ